MTKRKLGGRARQPDYVIMVTTYKFEHGEFVRI